MVLMAAMGPPVRRGPLAHKVLKDLLGLIVQSLDHKVLLDLRVLKDLLGLIVQSLDHKVLLVLKVLLDLRVLLDPRVLRVLKGQLGLMGLMVAAHLTYMLIIHLVLLLL